MQNTGSPNGKTVQICSLFQDSLRNPDILSVPTRALSTNKLPNDAARENHRGSDVSIARPAIAIIEALLKEGAQVQVYDPAAMPKAKDVLSSKHVAYANDPYEAAANCDALLILTEWKEFANLDLRRIRSLLKHPIVIDGRNLYPTDRMTSARLIYYSIGRAVGVPEPVSHTVRHSDGVIQFPLPTAIQPAVAG
jgi:hypothetical protein